MNLLTLRGCCRALGRPSEVRFQIGKAGAEDALDPKPETPAPPRATASSMETWEPTASAWRQVDPCQRACPSQDIAFI
jgi:hypothetical protein